MSTHSYPGFDIPSCHKHTPLERRRVELAPGVWGFVGYTGSNIGVIATEHGYLLIDTGDNLVGAAAVLREVRELAPGPLKGIVLTHGHMDHCGGASAFLEGEGEVPVWGHYAFGSEQRDSAGLEGMFGARTRRQFAFGLPPELHTENSLAPRPGGRPGVPAVPNRPVQEGKTVIEVDGVTLELYTAVSETEDHLIVWMPEKKVLFCGDTAYYSFPNVYPLRGCMYRDVEKWAATVRSLLEFDAQAILCGHVLALVGDEVREMLESYAEALEFVYAETVRGLNAGRSIDELTASVRLPEHLRDKPYLGEYYGSVAWTVRSILAAKAGWFDGDPVNIVPLMPKEEAERMAKMAGGEDRLLENARRALEEEDHRWAAKLAGYLIVLNGSDEAKLIKAAALEGISRDILPITGINYLKTCAHDLRSSVTQG